MTIWHMIPERFTMIKPKLGKSALMDTDFEIVSSHETFRQPFPPMSTERLSTPSMNELESSSRPCWL